MQLKPNQIVAEEGWSIQLAVKLCILNLAFPKKKKHWGFTVFGFGAVLFLFKFKTAARLMQHILKVVIQGNKVVGQMDLSWNILLSFLTWSFWMRFVKF